MLQVAVEPVVLPMVPLFIEPLFIVPLFIVPLFILPLFIVPFVLVPLLVVVFIGSEVDPVVLLLVVVPMLPVVGVVVGFVVGLVVGVVVGVVVGFVVGDVVGVVVGVCANRAMLLPVIISATKVFFIFYFVFVSNRMSGLGMQLVCPQVFH